MFKWLSAILAASSMIFWACQLSQNGKSEDTVSFTKIYDELSKYDSVVIIFKDRDGNLLDTVYKGKVDTHAEIEKLSVPHWDGGEAIITIVGLDGGVAVYHVDKKFDGKDDKTDTTIVIFETGISISSDVHEISIPEGDSMALPLVTVKPSTLSNPSVQWSTSNPDVFQVGETHLKAVKRGTAVLTAKLKADNSKFLAIQVTVEANGRIPESLKLSADTLFLASGGAAARLTVQAYPSTASNAVTWKTGDGACAVASADGLVAGLRNCETKLSAISKEDTSIGATAWVVVSDPIPVQRVRFLKDSTELFVGGAAEDLLVEVLPAKSNPAVDFVSTDPGKVSIKDNKISGSIEGEAWIVVSSKENPAIKDSLKVKVTVPQHVDGIQISPRSLKLFTGGESLGLTATVLPASATQKAKWISGNEGVATVDEAGKVSPVSPGNVKVYAVSLADSSRKDSVDVTVKRDAPQVSVGQDTIVSLGQTVSILPVVAPQEYGLVTLFKWDMDGNMVWDDSALVVKAVSYKYDQEKEYSARFYVRDTEGNETIAIKKVKAVKGPVILIVSPLNNSYTNQTSIMVKWRVDGKDQDSLPLVTLKDGANTITKTATDGAGASFSSSITVYLDTLKPNKPLVHGPASSTSATPLWTWATGGSGGNGIFRFAMDAEIFATAVETKDTAFLPAAPLSEATHTLFVQERDAAGNWSLSGKLSIIVDFSAPGKPTVTVNTPAVTNVARPVWSWTGTGGGSGAFQYNVDIGDFSSGAVDTRLMSFTPAADLSNGLHTVYVREKDSTGNWSPTGSAAVTIDLVAPAAPKISGASPTNALPKWTWTTGGGGGAGIYRSRLVDGNFPVGAPEAKDSVFILDAAASGTTYTLFVEEKDAAGNWSAAASLPIKYDLTKPSVTITSPLASGTYITTAATVAMAGTSAGPNAISKVTYSVDGGTSANATLGAGGAWSIPSIPIAEGKPVLITITATDALGNPGEAALSIHRDNTIPSPPISLSNPASPTNVATASWTWAPATASPDGPNGTGLNGQYQYNLNGGAWKATSTASALTLALAEGLNTFSVQEQDKAGNWSTSATSTVTLDTKAPDAVTFVGTDNSYSGSATPTWSWNPSGTNGGIGTYVLKMDAGIEFDYSSLATPVIYTPTTVLSDNQTHTLTVKQRDQVAGVVGTAKTFSFKIKVNAAGAPTVKSAVAALPNNGTTNNPKFTWTSGGGGNGNYRVKLDGGSYPANPQILSGSPLEWTISAADGVHTLYVSEQDQLGRWSNDGSFTINLDRTGPAITAVKVKDGGFDLRDGFITNNGSITISYKSDGTAKEFPCTLSNDNASNVCSFSETDGLGNKTTYTANVWKRSKVLFFKPNGIGDGSSWEAASGDMSLFTGNGSSYSDYDFWLGSGTYPGLSPQIPLNIYGGFNAAAYPTDTNGRDKTNTKMSGLLFDWVSGGLVDGVVMTGGFTVRIATMTMTDCQLQGGGSISVSDGGTLVANNLIAQNLSGFTNLIYVNFSTVTFNGGLITGNIPDGQGTTIQIDGTATFKGGLNLNGNFTSQNPYVILLGSGSKLTIDDVKNFLCSRINNAGGSGSCLGSAF